ncbi:MAG: HAMP domain-containing histidine kinase [Leptolyngbya sp. SIOISBB]|nr:HAMP domain-containing histidine kinase [Leptolyngbya sp. SIOISBB]
MLRRSRIISKVWRQQHSYQAKTAKLEEILGSVEHQVRQSLGLVNLYLSLLEGQPLDAQGQTVTGNLRTTVTEIAERLTTILGAPDGPNAHSPSVELRQFVSDRGRTFRPSLQAKHLTLQLPAETAWLQADPHQMGQVIDNLLCNAIAFSPQGGMIEWTWDVFEGEVLMQITDQGPGIPPQAGQAVFQPGYTQRPQGQGLGLAIVHKIVREHGGRIWVNNLAQGGAQFSVIFPQTQTLQSSPSPSSRREQSPECDYSRAAC